MIRGRAVVLGGVIAGLLVAPRAPLLAVPLAIGLAIAVHTGRVSVRERARRQVAIVAALACVGGAAAGHVRARVADPLVDRSPVSAVVTLLSAPEPDRRGAMRATVRLGERTVLLQAGRIPGAIGARLAVRGELQPPGFVARAFGATATLRAATVRDSGTRRGGLTGFVDGVRGRAERGLARGLPPPEAGLLRGMVLGQDEALARDTREDFRAAGLSHLTAASGQNVMLLAALAIAVGALLGVGIRARWWAALGLIALYVPLAGAGASIQRAGVMGAAGIAALMLGRPAVRWWALGLAAAATLALDPRAAEQPGWQMSFAAVVGILVLAGPTRERLALPRPAAEAIAITVAATLATAPLIALHFDRTSLVSLPANALAFPAVVPIMWLGMLAAAAGQVSASLAAPFNALASLPLAYLAEVARVAAAAPRAQAEVPWPVVTALCGLLAALLLRPRTATPRRRVHPLAAAAALASVLTVGLPQRALAPPAPGVLRVSFLDIGQGDATLLQAGGAAVLVDAGPADGRILRRLRESGIKALDLLVVTHGSADHLGGVPEVLGRLRVGAWVDGRDGDRSPVAAALDAPARGIPRLLPAPGRRLTAGPIVLDILHPAPGARAADPNDRAIVAVAGAYGRTVLLTADGESNVLQALPLADVDVLKVSHHGSADPGLPTVLERTTPDYAVIPVGRGNSYGHPAASTLAALRAVGRVLRTDRDGTVRIELSGQGAAPVARVTSAR